MENTTHTIASSEQELKEIVRQKYSEIALQGKEENMSSCCGATDCSTEIYNLMSDDYTTLEGYNADADLGLGCGLPTEYAKIKEGDVVIDLGSGAGNDCFVARKIVGAQGRVIGIDFTDAMLAKAKENAKKLGFENVQFRKGDIDEMPLTANIADVVISNCVLNLVPDKPKVFKEIFRVLKIGGHFSISDVVLSGSLPQNLQSAAEMYAGCVTGASQIEDYLKHIADAGFKNITIQKQKPIIIPDDILNRYLNENEIAEYKKEGNKISSITVFAQKKESCCAPGSSCC